MSAQTRFAWPDTAVDVSKYTTLEECQAATMRVRQITEDRDKVATGVWADTMPYDGRAWLEPLPAAVGETVRRCFARFAAPDSVPLAYFNVLFPHYLIAGWDDKASTLLERRIAAIRPNDDSTRAMVIDSAVQAYAGGVRPPRLAKAEAVVTEQTGKLSSRAKRLQRYLNLMVLTASEWRTDTARANRVLKRAVAIADSLTDKDRETLRSAKLAAVDLANENAASLEQQLYAVLNEAVGRRTFLDSLRKSTAAFVALKRDNWSKVTRRPPRAMEMPIGERAPEIEADIWLGRDRATVPRPSKGRVSLVAFINTNPHSGYAEHLYTLRRLARQFPQLEITVVTQSRGHFMHLKDSITPAKEAELTKRWLESFGVNATLAMASTEYWRLSEHDRRRINRPVANRTNYSFGKSWPISSRGATFLVDAEGILVHATAGPLSAFGEEEVAELIKVLLERHLVRS